MRKIITLLIIISSIYLCSPTIFADEKYDFRKVRWGMTKDEVKASESNKIEAEEDDAILYHCKVAGMESGLLYFFAKGRLVQATYRFRENYINKNNYISDFEKIKKILTQKYGLPTFYDKEWRNDLYKDNPQDWGLAVSMGHLWYSGVWETEATEIDLGLHGKNYGVSSIVVFISKKLIHLKEEEEEQRKAQEDF